MNNIDMAATLLIKCDNFERLPLAEWSHGVAKFVAAKLCASCLKFSVLSTSGRFLKIG